MHNSFCALIAHVRYFKILTWLRGFRGKVANFHDSIVSQFPDETRAQRKPNLTKYRKLSRKPRSHVRILIYRTWAIRKLDGLYQWSRLCVRGPAASQAMSWKLWAESVGDFSHYWEMVGTTFSSHGKRLVKVWVYFSQCWVHFGKWSEIFFKIPMLGIQWVFSPEYGKMMGLFFHKLGNISTCYSQFWEMQGTRNPHLGKGLVKVRVTFSRCRV